MINKKGTSRERERERREERKQHNGVKIQDAIIKRQPIKIHSNRIWQTIEHTHTLTSRDAYEQINKRREFIDKVVSKYSNLSN